MNVTIEEVAERLEGALESNSKLLEEVERLKAEIRQAVSYGKLEALNYTAEERERFGRWCEQNNDFLELKQQLSSKDAEIAELKKDKERLDWLESKEQEALVMTNSILNWQVEDTQTLRQVIDQARKI